ncbi:MAG: redox-regulated ATPase YchF [Planctomycetes bacterium RIFCSPHIGHO2_02_FULL_50_42]|nr:MAG: redox-regulated ATPase YchF [Planctomycetes bacterium GWA2_50_13]OHB90405.1 MAG: redox-regulated ATPase YchF [Planctomycetes bacterium RIFCSPHIGHO2_02_FULL_50_42]OHB94993.1 MAG: redox-regulated ATPase YchF [Planctomycetes bacterium RIFCSPLOWO2_02_FULL_50_16]HCN19204.1 redox-regulated ATPase YchF [Planctomycetia bacterium]
MKIGIIGLANSGKSTVFNALTGQNVPTTTYSTVEAEPNVGVVKVPDARAHRLAEIYKPKKVTFAAVEYIDYLGITKGDVQQNRKVLDMIKDVDAVVHVIRAFKDESVAHPLGGVNPLRDAETVELELLFSDLELVDKRLQRMEEAEKKGKKQNAREKEGLLRCKDTLEKEVPLRRVSLTEDETLATKHLQFISIKPEVMLLNIHEDSIGSVNPSSEGLLKDKFGLPVMSSSGKIEMEIAQLSKEEAHEFLRDLDINEPAMYRLIHLCYEHLGMISFLTVGKDEVRAWTVKKGTTAQKAAGKIHSDIERGFIRAEVVSYQDFIESGSMAGAREKGLVRLEGKTYQVQDGDIIDFRFSV